MANECQFKVFCQIPDLTLLLEVPQGSFHGPALFTGYTKPLGTNVLRYGIKYHLYTDDTQLYVPLDPGNKADVSSSLKNLEYYITDIHHPIASR